jgi:CHAT domain-containing protein
VKLRATAVLLLLTAFTAAERVTPASLYAEARLAFDRGDDRQALSLARAGQMRFGGNPKWNELFATVAVETRARGDEAKQALVEIKSTLRSNDAEAAVRRLMAIGYARANAYQGQGDADYAQADALAARVMPSLRAEIALRRAAPAFWSNQYELAQTYAEQALSLVSPAEQPYVFLYAHGMLATAAMAKREYQNAIEHFDRTARLARVINGAGALGRILGNSGWAYMQLGDAEEARVRFEQCVRISREHGDMLTLATFLGNSAAAFVAEQRFQEALPLANESVAVARKLGNAETAMALSNLAEVKIELGAYDAARESNHEAHALWPEGVSPTERQYLFLNDARIDAATGFPDRALRTLACLAETPKDLPLRWNAQAQMAAIYAKQEQLSEAEQMYDAALETGDQARVENKSADAYLVAFESLLIHFYDKYIDFLLRAGRTREALGVAERSRARTLLGDHRTPLVDAVALARAHDATILEYWFASRRSLLWVVTRDGISLVELPPGRSIDREIDAYRNEITDRGSSITSVRGARLFQTLVAPALPHARSKRFIIIPDGHLGAINLEALIAGNGDEPHYWIDDAIVSFAPSLALIPPLNDRRSFSTARALVIGDVPAQGSEFPALAQARDEINDVAGHFGHLRTRVVTGEHATRSAYLTADLRQFSYIHFVAHGTASVRSPLESSVVLAGGRLSAEQIIHAPLGAELVTVSSCSSARGRTYAGEGPVGLAWAFLRAGAHRVVASQWDVSDSATSKVMDHMYASLAKGRDHADALREAKLELVHSGGKYSRPYYWAPFILYGAP